MRKITPTEELRMHYEYLFNIPALTPSGKRSIHYCEWLESNTIKRISIHKVARKFMRLREFIRDAKDAEKIKKELDHEN